MAGVVEGVQINADSQRLVSARPLHGSLHVVRRHAGAPGLHIIPRADPYCGCSSHRPAAARRPGDFILTVALHKGWTAAVSLVERDVGLQHCAIPSNPPRAA